MTDQAIANAAYKRDYLLRAIVEANQDLLNLADKILSDDLEDAHDSTMTHPLESFGKVGLALQDYKWAAAEATR